MHNAIPQRSFLRCERRCTNTSCTPQQLVKRNDPRRSRSSHSLGKRTEKQASQGRSPLQLCDVRMVAVRFRLERADHNITNNLKRWESCRCGHLGIMQATRQKQAPANQDGTNSTSDSFRERLEVAVKLPFDALLPNFDRATPCHTPRARHSRVYLTVVNVSNTRLVCSP